MFLHDVICIPLRGTVAGYTLRYKPERFEITARNIQYKPYEYTLTSLDRPDEGPIEGSFLGREIQPIDTSVLF